MAILPFRQVHLDFHTSPDIPDVGIDFDAAQFVRTLKAAAVNSVTIFARCHHGLSYYPTKVGTAHPSLRRDLLGEMIEACHKEGIQAPIYLTVVWDEDAGTKHPEWRQVDPSGALVGRPPFSKEWGWKWLCMNSPYSDYMAAQTQELCSLYPVDGVFYDIVMQNDPGCVCTNCLTSMKKLGLDPASDADLQKHTLIVARAFMRRMTGIVHASHPQARVFYNSRMRLDPNPETGVKGEADAYTHWEIESLPSGGWGYDHFPLFARYFQTTGKEFIGMTGRFHLSWADFGGMKNQPALEYECFRHLALGAGNSIGDQLHPRGQIDQPTYDLIGSVYRQVEAVEPWCADAQPLADIGLLIPGDFPRKGESRTRETLEGAMHMLTEGGHQFQIIDTATDLSRYRVIIAPDDAVLTADLAAHVRDYLAQGGALLLSARSGLKLDESGFALDEIGLDYGGPAAYAPNYFHITAATDAQIACGIPATDYVMYEQGCKVTQRAGTEMLVEEGIPYFNRTWEHFCSHQHTPYDRPSGLPMVTKRGKVVYFASPIFHTYRIFGNHVYKALFLNALNMLLPAPLVRTSLPSAGEVTVLEQAAGLHPSRLICHLLHYTPQRRSARVEIIENVVPLFDVSVAVRCDFKPARVYLAPQLETLPFAYDGSYVRCRVPRIDGHQLLVVEAG